MSWLLAFAGFAVLIILHEAGHFAAAKAVGMRVERFFLFFPPKLLSTRRGETEYGIGAIPLGGFVKITGMNPDEELPPEIAARGYYQQPVWKRIVVIAAGPAVNIAIAFALLFGLALNAEAPTTLQVRAVEKGTPAEGQLRPGDRILSVDGVAVRPVAPPQGVDDIQRNSDQLDADVKPITDQIASHKCAGTPADGCLAATAATVRVLRDGRPTELRLRPFYDAQVKRPRLGFGFEFGGQVAVNPTAGEAAGLAVDQMWLVTSKTASVLGNIFNAEQRKQISGVVGNYDATRQAFEFDARTAILILAIISLSLGLINLLPFLPLDGGHIFWSVVEKLRGRPVSFSVMERASFLGFALVMMLFVIGLTNDIGRLASGEGFGVR
jgi:regulator of sigma E protease